MVSHRPPRHGGYKHRRVDLWFLYGDPRSSWAVASVAVLAKKFGILNVELAVGCWIMAITNIYIYVYLCIYLVHGSVWQCMGSDHILKIMFSPDSMFIFCFIFTPPVCTLFYVSVRFCCRRQFRTFVAGNLLLTCGNVGPRHHTDMKLCNIYLSIWSQRQAFQLCRHMLV